VVTLNINGETRSVDALDDMPLLWVLRDVVGLTGTPFASSASITPGCSGRRWLIWSRGG
jgi:isoquinoline 1-oxidoreductase subunit alpha